MHFHITTLIRLIPESMIIILIGYAFSKKTFEFQLFILSGVLHALCTFIFKSLPVGEVMSMILSAFTAVVLLVKINKLLPSKAIFSTIICFILSIILEGINMLFLKFAMNLDLNEVFINSTELQKELYGLPSLVAFALIAIVWFIVSRRGIDHHNEKENDYVDIR